LNLHKIIPAALAQESEWPNPGTRSQGMIVAGAEAMNSVLLVRPLSINGRFHIKSFFRMEWKKCAESLRFDLLGIFLLLPE